MQRNFISEGQIELVDDVEAASLKLRQFIDRVKNAAYGYAGFFDAVKVKQEELAAIYEYDLQFLDLEDEIARAIENIPLFRRNRWFTSSDQKSCNTFSGLYKRI